ncbi:MAG: tRNA(His) guanylyltransferase Thg1 family protein [Lachnospiraceae bacterium]|nr:tRNA(His) guanylyltransferase Thg1 family protein [Lachnospiraceae bacterium]
MAFQDNIGDRMKNNYENISKTKLMRRCPVVVRLDGRAFHTFTRGFNKPFDAILVDSMQDTMRYLCKNIQGCVFGYTQSDEITLILIDYQTFESEAFFDYEVQKLCSVIASMATMYFNKWFEARSIMYKNYYNANQLSKPGIPKEWSENNNLNNEKYIEALFNAIDKGATFDCRVFNIPKEEVANLIYWRQLDAMRNSVQMVGQANFSHKQLQGKSCEQIKEMLITEKNINWDNFPIYLQRGTACYKQDLAPCLAWYLDEEMPIIKDNRAYIEDLIYLD